MIGIYKLIPPEDWIVIIAVSSFAASNWACACYFQLRELNKKMGEENEADNTNKGR